MAALHEILFLVTGMKVYNYVIYSASQKIALPPLKYFVRYFHL